MDVGPDVGAEATHVHVTAPAAPPAPTAGLERLWLRGTPNPQRPGRRGSGSAGERLALLTTLLDTVSDAVLVTEAEPCDEPGPRIVYANAAFLRHTGYALEEVLGRSPRFLQGPQTSCEARAELRRALEEWRPVRVELLNHRKDGSPFWVELDITPVADETGWFTHWVSVQRDVTERRRAQEQNLALNALVSGVLASTPAQTAVLDPAGRIVSVNGAWERFWAANGGADACGGAACDGTGCGADTQVGVDYVALCRAATGPCSGGAVEAADGIEAVLSGAQPSFSLDYECSSPTERRWFRMQVSPLLPGPVGAASGPDDDAVAGAGYLVVSHYEMTARTRDGLPPVGGGDPLTGLADRAGLLAQLAVRLELTTAPVALLLCDVDGFRAVNEALGHAAGDAVLRHVAARLQRSVRPGDVVGRLSGDEFAVVVEAGPAEAELLAARLAERVGEPLRQHDVPMVVTLSTGIAVAPPRATDQPGDAEAVAEDLLRDAEAALSRARASGGARSLLFHAGLRADAARRLSVSNALATATRDGSLRLHYQPIVDLATGRVRKREALLRWWHEGALRAPDHFLDVAEATGAIRGLGAWVLERAVADAAAWAARGDTAKVTVNLSAQQIGPALPGQVAELLDRYGLPGDRLVVEVTETSVLTDMAEAVAVLSELRRQKVGVLLDDFGTGYCSLVYLTSLPVDGLKVDRRFVAGLDTPQGRAVVTAVAGLARSLGLGLVAEGVETPEIADALRHLGYPHAQGYLFGRPVPIPMEGSDVA
ncbi:MAG TPA: EAL domain-containing protein [Motilibacteraceae bacterium]|nr:EAL domain-containing protein [Motilibacteraceae bacterium]